MLDVMDVADAYQQEGIIVELAALLLTEHRTDLLAYTFSIPSLFVTRDRVATVTRCNRTHGYLSHFGQDR